MQPIPYFGETLKGKWIYEPKIDGWRMQIIKYRDGHAECWGRRIERHPDWSQKLRSVVERAEDCLPKGILLDCELTSTQGRRFIPSLFSRAPKAQPIVYVFDVVYFHNRNISRLHLASRKEIIKTLNLPAPFFIITGKPANNLKKHFKKETSQGHEGLVIKKMNSAYRLGIEAPIATEHWRKIK
jgi:ATP-dependent DNA ligase